VAFLGRGRYLAAMISIRPFRVGALAVAAAALAMASPAQAARSKKHAAVAAPAPAAPASHPLGTFDSWTAYESQDKTGRVCYLVGQPQKSAPSGLTRKSPMAMVTHRPAENIANVVSFVEGYPLKEGSDVALDIGASKFELFTKDDSAWARTSDLDKSIVTTLAKAKQAVVKGTPQKGPPTTDTYALAGFPQALAAIDKACGIKREEKTAVAPAPTHPHKKAAAHR
jgi:invasion associated locus B (IalB) protein